MKRCIATVLLMLSIEALVAGRLSAAVADDDHVDTIRLPSHGLAEEVMAAPRKNGGEERPWKCCDVTVCTRSFPPTCRCLDKVKHCASTCKRCEASKSDPSRRVCNDRYHGDPGPSCTKDANGNDNNVPSGVARDHQVMAAAANVGKTKGGDEERPWKCCDVTVCTRSFPPTCRCLDKVKHCASTCKRCEASESDPSLHVCNDWYHGDPGPRCTEDADSAIGAGGN